MLSALEANHPFWIGAASEAGIMGAIAFRPVERQETLQKSWSLAEKVLIVSARLTTETKALGNTTEFADGCLTSRGTFQKFYDQHELKIRAPVLCWPSLDRSGLGFELPALHLRFSGPRCRLPDTPQTELCFPV